MKSMPIQRLMSLPAGMVPFFHELEQKTDTDWYCGSDPPQGRVGSGGGTAHILAEAYRDSAYSGSFTEWIAAGRRMVIHSGGASSRLPAYAPYGKSLIPMPVFRWSKGQYIDQKLLEFQAAYYEEILKWAPAVYSLLIGTGDVMFLSSDRFRDLPEADVLVFGIWVEDAVATRHGVFFSRRDQPDRLSFVRQKPSEEELTRLAQDHFYLMDSGIVLMNAKTTMKLMAKSGWEEPAGRFTEGAPRFYDLYGEMLTSFGGDTRQPDPDLTGLDVKLVPLHEAEFYHFGSNRDLIDSTLKLQNRVTDQRLKFSRETDRHPSIFQQNSRIDVKFQEGNHHLWIENSAIPAGWELDHHHILTGVPENDWQVSLPAGICIDVVPVGETYYCLRVYGFDDRFGSSPANGADWMGHPLESWLEMRSVTMKQAGIGRECLLQEAPLFPLVRPEEIKGMIDLLLHEKGHPAGWLKAERLSAEQLSREASVKRLYRQRRNFQLDSLPRMAEHHSRSIFYYLDLDKVAAAYRENHLELPPALPEKEPVIKRIHDQMFRARALGRGKVADGHEKKAFSILREAMIDTLRSEPLYPVRNVLEDQILWGRSPVRLDLAGGWTDTPPYSIMEGGKVVNLSVELNGQLPLQVYIRPLSEPKIVLRSIDLGQKLEISSVEELHRFDRPGSSFAIPMAALVLSGFGPMFSGAGSGTLEKQLRLFGCGIEMSLLAAIPKGSGLGTSSNLAATVLGTLNEFCGLNWDRHQVAYRTLILEQMLTTGGGWQDQFGGIFEGVKLLETGPGIRQEPKVKWLPDQLFTGQGTRELMLLYYTGETRVARDILGEIVKGMFLNSNSHLRIFSEMKAHALETFETILASDYQGLAEKVALSWELNQQLDEGTNPPMIQAIIRKVDDYLLGYKLLGAGGGGYLLMLAKSAEAAIRVRSLLEGEPPNKRARFVGFRVSRTGFQVSRS